MTIRVALLGFGTVGQGVYEILQNKQKQLTDLIGEDVEICGLLVQNKLKERAISDYVFITDNFEDIINQNPDVIFEAINGEEPSHSYLKEALDKNIHVVTANKVMFATYGQELLEKAGKYTSIGYEATTASGTPVIGTLMNLLQVNQITKVEAILNGTSNYILTAMQEDGKPFSEALQEAQDKGYAEADPTNDIEGYDAFYKLMIVSQLLYNRQPLWSEVPLQGISHISEKDITKAKQQGEKFRHVATLELVNDSIQANVQPISLPSSHGLYAIDGVDNAIDVTGDLVGSVTLRGPGAGKLSTASAMVEDFVRIFQASPVKQLS
ncbi:homoserine dehydrogenase [Halobacillus seohaensis]|uniref:Homoserine dehydrogenase n=1 Tax=Halobacillus seohaensis TaxID=447421 RepID=A0ABW2EPX3_9BACI